MNSPLHVLKLVWKLLKILCWKRTFELSYLKKVNESRRKKCLKQKQNEKKWETKRTQSKASTKRGELLREEIWITYGKMKIRNTKCKIWNMNTSYAHIAKAREKNAHTHTLGIVWNTRREPTVRVLSFSLSGSGKMRNNKKFIFMKVSCISHTQTLPHATSPYRLDEINLSQKKSTRLHYKFSASRFSLYFPLSPFFYPIALWFPASSFIFLSLWEFVCYFKVLAFPTVSCFFSLCSYGFFRGFFASYRQ